MAAAVDEIVLTFDVDWAPEPMLDALIETLTKSGLAATFFATHDSPLLRSLSGPQFELALHPKFTDPTLDPERPLAALLDLYPDAVGVRSHSLAFSSTILAAYRAVGLRYEANTFLPLHPGLRPVDRLPGLASLPHYWADDHHFLYDRPRSLPNLYLEHPGLKALIFHPIHVYMNTSGPDHYARFKPHYQDVAALATHVNREHEGIGTIFRDVVELLRGGSRPTRTLRAVWEEWDGSR